MLVADIPYYIRKPNNKCGMTVRGGYSEKVMRLLNKVVVVAQNFLEDASGDQQRVKFHPSGWFGHHAGTKTWEGMSFDVISLTSRASSTACSASHP